MLFKLSSCLYLTTGHWTREEGGGVGGGEKMIFLRLKKKLLKCFLFLKSFLRYFGKIIPEWGVMVYMGREGWGGINTG